MKNLMILKIKGKNVKSFINKLSKNKINLYNIEYLNKDEINITIDVNDYQLLKQNKSTYEITIINYKGFNKIKNKIEKNFILITFILIGLALIITLSNIIFKVEVIYDEENIRTLLINELRLYDIDKYKFVKSFKEVEQIKKEIMNKYKDKIEWLEIERVGTKYIIKVEERKINNIKSDDKYQDIVSTKDAVIKKIVAVSGEVVREVNEYVSKGDTIISGSVYLNGELKGLTKADGIVYGEVWYKLSIEYPKVDIVKEETGNKKEVLSINFLNKSIRLFEGKKYESSIVKKNYLFKNNILPISISKDKMYELKVISGIYTDGEALLNARKYSRRKIEETLKENEYIISDKVLNYRVNSNTIYMDVFYKVYSNITGIKEIVGDNND